MEIIIKTQKGSKDYREWHCENCGIEESPGVRFDYHSPKLRDKYGNAIIDGEIVFCSDCARKKGFKVPRN